MTKKEKNNVATKVGTDAKKEKKEDVRVTKTKRDLRNALIFLVKSKALDKITVCELCDVAIVNRMTFYKHYADKYELFEDVFCQAKDRMIDELRRHWEIHKNEDPVSFFGVVVRKIIETLLDSHEELGAIVRQENPVVISMIFRAVQEAFAEMVGSYGATRPCKYDKEEIALYLAGGLGLSIANYLQGKSGRERAEFVKSNEKIFTDFLSSDIFFGR